MSITSTAGPSRGEGRRQLVTDLPTAAKISLLVAVAVVTAVAVDAFAGLFFSKGQPLVNQAQAAFDELAAQDDLTRDPHVRSQDEFGRMAASLGSAQDSLRATVETITPSARALAASELTELSEQLSQVVGQFRI